jgi:hypothetical protein
VEKLFLGNARPGQAGSRAACGRDWSDGVTEKASADARRAMRTFEKLGDEEGLAHAWMLQGAVFGRRDEVVTQQEAGAQALVHARNAGGKKEEAVIRGSATP